MNDGQRDRLHLRIARSKHDPSNVRNHVRALEELRAKALQGRSLSDRRAAAKTYKALTGVSP